VPQLTIVDDALAGRRLAALRDTATPSERFRVHARALGALLAREALRDLPVTESEVAGPLGRAPARLPAAAVVAVPVLRAGLGLLPGVHDLVPDATVGMVGLERDPDSLTARRYYDKVPPLDDAWVLVLEPMLATGGSAADALDVLDLRAAARVTVLAVVATRQAVDLLAERHPDVAVVTAAVDPGLDDNGYIVPGLGDFGDRVLGTPHA
jgi:uracil phosphoribosyltransferase